MAGLPVLTGTGVILLIWRFPIDAERQGELRARLCAPESREAAAS